jgi:hypothetical protein
MNQPQKEHNMSNSPNWEVVYAFPKSAREEIWAYIQEYRGQKLFHLRTFTTNEDNGGRPTTRGIALSVDDLSELKTAVERLCLVAEGATDD